MKKILISLSIIGVVGALVIGGTVAHFFDEERVDVRFEAGTLDLTVARGNAVITKNIDDIEPGDSGSRYVRLENVGTLAGEIDIHVGTITNTEAVRTRVVRDRDRTVENEFADETPPGELGTNLEAVFWIDRNQDGNFNKERVGNRYIKDIELLSNGTTSLFHPTDNYSLNYVPINDYSGDFWNAIWTMGGGAFDNFVMNWRLPAGTGNQVQGDRVNFEIIITLEQPARDQ
jgi:hypothetical protein